MRWCIRRDNDSLVPVMDNMTTYGDVINQGCQNFMTSSFMYNVTLDDVLTTVVCEIGGGECGSGAVSSAVNITGGNYTYMVCP